ncbi:hypothetical protein L7F22_057558 [Adiantum nelumboides]|nr:hypothetical protein [Adiantum nelumboides]
MPTRRTRRRKSRKGKPSSRKKSTSRKRSRRCVPANALSSDDDYVLESDGEDSSSDTDQNSISSADDENEQEREGKEEEEEGEEDYSSDAKNDSYRSARSGASKRRRCRRHKRNSSDEDFNVDLERDSSDDGCAGEGPSDPRSARTAHTASQRQKRQKRCKQDSSDEDFEMTVEEGLNIGDWTEGFVAARPITRAMEAGHVTDSSTEGLVSYPVKLEGRNANLDALPKANLKMGEPSHSISSSSARGGSTIEKDTAADKKKGKEKVLEGEKATASQLTLGIAVSVIDVAATSVVVCGICLNETATIERGKLDCCDHFFCFGCIMEWAKVESRCPMCKQRFAIVAKAGSGMSKRTRTVRIPLRDQVYVPPEDDLPFEDPYADVICMECHGIGDEGLLLLCDRCDSAAHTFCVGLGRSVPRGDWYCRDCQALVGENSGSESEAEELVLASDSGEDEEFLVRSIVASESQPTRQRRVQRVPGATIGPPSRSRRRLGAGGRRMWRRLLSRRGRGRRVATAPQLSQTARAFLSSRTSELTPVTPLSETPKSGSARTVPQQRRLQERIIAMRNNWGRIQNGDVQFDAIRTPSAESFQPFSGTAVLTSGTDFTADNRVDFDSVEIPPQGDKDLERAWRMMGQAQNLSAGTSSSGMHQQWSILSHHAPPPPCPLQSFQAAASTNVGTSSVPRINIDRPTTHDAFCRSSESSDVGTRRAIKERPHVSSVRGKEFTVSPILTAEIRKERKQDYTYSLTLTKCPIDSCSMSQQLTGGNIAADAVNTCNKGEKNAFSTEMEPQGIKLQRNYLGRTHIDTGIGFGKSGLSHAKESNGAKSYCSPPHEVLKVHLIELVKKQTWPVYIAERLDKEQFKRIARAAVHSLLALCENNKSLSLSCNHFEDQGKDPIVNCCTKCLDQHVENAVRTAKDKIVPR